jgi:hypothetical protein
LPYNSRAYILRILRTSWLIFLILVSLRIIFHPFKLR